MVRLAKFILRVRKSFLVFCGYELMCVFRRSFLLLSRDALGGWVCEYRGPDTGLGGVSLQSYTGDGERSVWRDGQKLLLWAVRERDESKMTPAFQLEYMTCIFSGEREFGNGNTTGRKLDWFIYLFWLIQHICYKHSRMNKSLSISVNGLTSFPSYMTFRSLVNQFIALD